MLTRRVKTRRDYEFDPHTSHRWSHLSTGSSLPNDVQISNSRCITLLSQLQGVQHCSKCACINNIGPGFGISRFKGEAKA